MDDVNNAETLVTHNFDYYFTTVSLIGLYTQSCSIVP